MKKEYAEEVAAQVIEHMERGTAPWQKPWRPGELRQPYNPITGKEYRGMNSIWLYMQGYSDPRWMTYKQAAAQGAQVRRGSRGTHVVYWKFNEERKATDEQGRPILDPDTGQQKIVTVQFEHPRSFPAVVFNASQIDGLSPLEAQPIIPEPERQARAEAVLVNSGADIRHESGDRAFYQLSTDSIRLPARNQFPTADNYYATALHELGHWTGHSSRLNRDLFHPFGSEGYAREELRAEIASLMLGERLGIGHDPSQHVAYVGSWVKVLRKNPWEIFQAASDAERISNYVTGFEQEQMLSLPSVVADQPSASDLPGEASQEQFASVVAESADNYSSPQAVYVQYENPENSMQSRTYLAVPYAEKNEAKALGARWDKVSKSWYAPEDVDVATSGLDRWSLDRAGVIIASEPKSAIEQFKDVLKETGLQLKGEVVTNGMMQRVPVEGDKGGATSGAYAYHTAGCTPGGFIQNYKTGEVVHWKPEGKTPRLSAVERARQAAETAGLRKARNAARQSKYEATAEAAQALWNESPSAAADNAYCQAKGITNPVGLRIVPDRISPATAAHGIKIAKTVKEAKELREADPRNRVFKVGDLLIPGIDDEGKLWTLQSINPYFKSFMKDGRKAGLYTVAGGDEPGKHLSRDEDFPLVLAEGYATADTVSRLLDGKPVVVAFDSGNLNAVAHKLRERYPSRILLIAADNDHKAVKELDVNGKPRVNIGLVKAKEVAAAYGGGVMVPQFKDGEKGSDWNDFALSRGDEAARQMLVGQMALAKREAMITAERLTTLARTRDMEARNDPTTSADDAAIAVERGHAAGVLAEAQYVLSEVRGMAIDGLISNAKGARALAAVKAGIDHKIETMHDRAKEEREEVLNHGLTGPLDSGQGEVSWGKLPDEAKQAIVEDVKNGKEVVLPKDAPARLRQMAGYEPAPATRARSRGIDVDF